MAYTKKRYPSRGYPTKYRKGARTYGRKSYRPKGPIRRSKYSSAVRNELSNVKSELRKMQRGTQQKTQLLCMPAEVPFFMSHADSGRAREAYFILPLTAALPPHNPQLPGLISDSYRKNTKVYVSGVKIQGQITHMYGFELCAAAYYVRPTHLLGTIGSGADGIPNAFWVGSKTEDGEPPRLLTLSETGITAARNGPFKLVPIAGGGGMEGDVPLTLDSHTGTMYDCALEGPGGPVGTVEWTVDRNKEKSKGRVCKMSVASSMSAPGTVSSTPFSMFIRLDKSVVFSRETSGQLVSEQPLQVLFEVRSKSDLAYTEKPNDVHAGAVKNLKMDLYFSS